MSGRQTGTEGWKWVKSAAPPPRLTVTLVRKRIGRIIRSRIRRFRGRILRVVIILVVGGKQRLWCSEVRMSTSAINQFYSAFQKARPTQPPKLCCNALF